jgi:anti-sigma regulatory factor (Ser/Thr protein kinase)
VEVTDDRCEALWFRVQSSEDVGHVRRCIAAAAKNSGFGADHLARIDVVASEMATNLVRYAEGVRGIWWAPQPASGGPSAVLVSMDGGPGIRDLSAAMQDGVTGGGGLGGGLGGMRRLSDDFAVFSAAARTGENCPPGTLVAAAFGPAPPAWILMRRHPQETCCGDGCAVITTETGLLLGVIDGLGHGQGATDAAVAAISALGRVNGEDMTGVFELLDRALRGQRGAAVTIARLEPDTVEWAGVGNVEARLLPAPSRHLVTTNGTLGVGCPRRPRVERQKRADGGLIVLTSDGVSSRWHSELPSELVGHPMLLAAHLMRDFSRDRDDATVMVART